MVLDFLTTLLGGAYYAGKYAYYSIKDSVASAQMSNNQTMKATINAQIESTQEEKVRAKAFVNNSRACEGVRRIFSEDLKFVFGEQWEDATFKQTPYYNDRQVLTEVCKKWIPHLILAKEGKVDPYNLSFGYKVSSGTEKIEMKFLQRIEMMMREVNPELSIVFVPYKGRDRYGQPSYIFKHSWGEFMFEHALTLGSKYRKEW